MDTTKTISALLSWGELFKAQEVFSPRSCPRLRIINNGLEVQHALTFWEKICDWILSFFGVGDRSLARVFSVARKALFELDTALYADKRRDLEHALRLLNKKATHYNSRKWLNLFKMPRAAIARLLTLPKVASIPSKKSIHTPQIALFPNKRNARGHAETSHVQEKIASPVKPDILEQTYAAVKKPACDLKDKNLVRHCGISNEGNTCFAAATLQALLPLHLDINHEDLRAFCAAVERGVGEKKGIRKLLESLSSSDWHYEELREGDPVTFLEDRLLAHLKGDLRWVRRGEKAYQAALVHQNVASLPAGETMQEVVNGKYFKHPVEVASPIPTTFAVCLQGRESGESYNDKPVKRIDKVELSVDGDKKVPYRLASVVIYAGHHYYTLVPQYGSDGTAAFWTEYDDSVVSQVERTSDLDRLLESRGYLFFYIQTS